MIVTPNQYKIHKKHRAVFTSQSLYKMSQTSIGIRRPAKQPTKKAEKKEPDEDVPYAIVVPTPVSQNKDCANNVNVQKQKA
jgi:hypothetical protein